MDTTFVYNQVKIPTGIKATVGNMPSLPDSIHVSIDNMVNVAQEGIEPITIWGMTLDWGAIVIPTVSTIIVFVVGVIIDIILKRRASKRKTKEFRETVFSWVSLISEPTIKQISRVRKLVFDISLNQTLQNVRFEFSNSISNKLEIISAENIIHYFIFNSSKPKQDKRAEYAFNVISTLDFLSKVENEVIKKFDVYQRQSLGLMNDWNPAIIDLQNIILNVSHSDKEDKLFNQIASSFYVWQQKSLEDDEVDVKKAYSILIKPIQRICGGHQLGELGFEKVDAIVLATKQLDMVYNKWEKLNSGFCEVFSGYAESMQTTLNGLISAINYFKENTIAIK